MSPADRSIQLEGSLLDTAVFGSLAAAAIVVLMGRQGRIRCLLAATPSILIYFGYCLISVTWSYHPDIALKRWIKAIGDLAMVLIVVSDRQPLAAFGRVVSHVGFVLLPASVLLIKYYPTLGRSFGPFGLPENTGVNTDKNMLGLIVLVISIYTVWCMICLWRAKGQAHRSRHLIAQATLLGFGVALFKMANSSTSTACFILGSALIMATSLRSIRRYPGRVHILCLTMVIGGGLTLPLGGGTAMVQALGRQSTLTGRTDIWAALLASAPDPIVGAGFESYWLGPNVRRFQGILSQQRWWHPEDLNEAHNGYLEVYLELGWLGVCLIAWMLISGYRRAVAAYRSNRDVGGLLLSYIIVSAVYNITEAGFRMLDPMWVFLLFAVVGSPVFASDRSDNKRCETLAPGDGKVATTRVKKELALNRVGV